MEVEIQEKLRQRQDEKEKEERQRQDEKEKEERQRQDKKEERQRQEEENQRQFERQKKEKERKIELEKFDRECRLRESELQMRFKEAEINNHKKDSIESHSDMRDTARKFMPELRPDQDIIGFMKVFERTARDLNWKKEHWVIYLRPLLTGPAMQAYSNMEDEASRSYENVKHEILKKYSVSRGVQKPF